MIRKLCLISWSQPGLLGSFGRGNNALTQQDWRRDRRTAALLEGGKSRLDGGYRPAFRVAAGTIIGAPAQTKPVKPIFAGDQERNRAASLFARNRPRN
jgi:hypothetical protein